MHLLKCPISLADEVLYDDQMDSNHLRPVGLLASMGLEGDGAGVYGGVIRFTF